MVSCQDDGSPAGLETPDRFTELADRKKEIWYQVVVGQLPFPLQHHKLVVNPKCSAKSGLLQGVGLKQHLAFLLSFTDSKEEDTFLF